MRGIRQINRILRRAGATAAREATPTPIRAVGKMIGCLIAAVLTPLFILGIAAIVFLQLQWASEKSERRAVAKTEQELTRAADRIQRESRSQGRLLFEDEGNSRLRSSHKDGWRAALTYEVIDEHTFIIRSYGSDGRRNTEDDMILQKKFRPAANETNGDS